ncbi:3-isopropylmalate dehydrogenase [Oleiphilus messinensis]|uniref:3-isopropylmalate dehydrogenase n=2 Tax=Oleiphilus messinensis TaxID=141451 RepID=A0A1Y0I5V0_9GAMM|nr:3-isopropylmalate dehydrogenase [Oleiphilus messinensis]
MNQGKRWRIGVLPGDGIGTEVVSATMQVLELLRDRFELGLDWQELPWPSTAWHQHHGEMMPADALEQVRKYDALLLGALGDPGPLSDVGRYRLSDGDSLAPLLTFRKGLDLWACERPARLLSGAPQYLADPRAREVDMLVVRENSEGEYVNQGGRLHRGTPFEIATQVEVFTRAGTERLIRHGFQRARQRLAERQQSGDPPKQYRDTVRDAPRRDYHAQVCLITKRNALPHWGELYTEVFQSVACEFPEIATHHELIDAACMKFVQSPWVFDVVIASNLQGDILTDLAAVLSGGMGVAPSCNINPDRRDVPALFEPTHGSAPDIVKQGIADPRAMMLTAAMMLAWLGVEDERCALAAKRVEWAVQQDLLNQKTDRAGQFERGGPGSPRSTADILECVLTLIASPESKIEK